MFKDKIKINTVDFYHNRNDKELELVENDKILLSNYTLGIKEFKCLTWHERLALLEKYIIENGKLPSRHNKNKKIIKMSRWIEYQKINYMNNLYLMKDEYIKKKFEDFLEKYKELFKTNKEILFNNLNEVEKYILKNCKLPPNNSKDKNIMKMATWINHQKERVYKNINEEIRKVWETFINKYKELFKSYKEIWFDNLKQVEEYILKNRKLPSYNSKDKNIINIYNWIETQKKTYKIKIAIMNNEEIRKIWQEFIDKYSDLFKTNKELWIDNLKKLEEYILKNHRLPSQYNKNKNVAILGKFTKTQKNKYKYKKSIMKNEEIRKQWEEFIEKYKELF